ncbi:MAG: polysaccharide biosynthesis protein [Candidatus Eremiobacteraeota bacterium]|nr:polysaccharide biosynthesis protein [Candidatus Eremiobacteraeota bacterium]
MQIGNGRRARTFLRGTPEFAANGLLILASSVVANAGSFALYFVGSRHLDQRAYGDFYALVTATALAGALTTSASLVISKTTAELRSQALAASLGGFTMWCRRAALAVAAAVFAIGCAAIVPISNYLHLVSPAEALPWALATSITMAVPAYRGILQGCEDFVPLSISFALEGVGRGVLGSVAILCGYGVVGALVAQGVAALLTWSYVAAVVRKRFAGAPPATFAPDARFFHTLLATGAALVATASLASLDVLFAKHYLGARDAAVYGVVAFCGRVVILLGTFVPLLTIPKVAAALGPGRSPLPVLAQALAATGAVGLVALVPFVAFPHLVVRFFAGSGYSDAAQYVLLYGGIGVLLSLTNAVTAYQLATHRFRFIVPLAAAACIEAGAIAAWHDSIATILAVALACNALALIASAFGIATSGRTAPATP